MRVACFGGVYSNYLALEAAMADAERRGVDALYCLGDFGAFGPHPNRALEMLRSREIICIQGNYDHSIGNNLDDCQCGYTDPRDNHFAQISYDYTQSNTAAEHRVWMKSLPPQRQLDWDGMRTTLAHGSPRKVNEFLWESTSPDHYLEALCQECQSDLLLVTHTGIKWDRPLASGRRVVNVGVLGRPENDGATHVWYTLLECGAGVDCSVRFIPVEYDFQRLAQEMRHERLPSEFVETIVSGWWTTCLEVLPSKERRRGKF